MQSLNVLDGLIEFRSFHRPSSQVRKIGRTERIAGCNLSLLWVRFKLFEMKEFRRFELHKFTAGILKIQASPPRFKRCLRGDTVHRFLACWNTYSGHLWPTVQPGAQNWKDRKNCWIISLCYELDSNCLKWKSSEGSSYTNSQQAFLKFNKIQASPPRFKRCLRGDTVHRFLACWNTYSGHLWPTYFALATEFFLHSFPVSITDDELPARNYRRTLKAPIQDQLQSCTRFFTGICQHSRHNLS